MNRCLILWTGNHKAGREQSQKRKKAVQSRVSVPEFLMVFGMSLYDVQMLRSISLTQVPPIHPCTPYQIQAITARLNTGQSEPQMPKEDLATTGKPM